MEIKNAASLRKKRTRVLIYPKLLPLISAIDAMKDLFRCRVIMFIVESSPACPE